MFSGPLGGSTLAQAGRPLARAAARAAETCLSGLLPLPCVRRRGWGGAVGTGLPSAPHGTEASFRAGRSGLQLPFSANVVKLKRLQSSVVILK